MWTELASVEMWLPAIARTRPDSPQNPIQPPRPKPVGRRKGGAVRTG